MTLSHEVEPLLSVLLGFAPASNKRDWCGLFTMDKLMTFHHHTLFFANAS